MEEYFIPDSADTGQFRSDTDRMWRKYVLVGGVKHSTLEIWIALIDFLTNRIPQSDLIPKEPANKPLNVQLLSSYFFYQTCLLLPLIDLLSNSTVLFFWIELLAQS